MEKGDCLYFSGEERHDLRSVGTSRAEVLVVVSVGIDPAVPATPRPDLAPAPLSISGSAFRAARWRAAKGIAQ